MKVVVGTEILKINEVENGSFGCYLWASALVLTFYLQQNKFNFKNRRVLELGAGVGLCGLYLAKIGATVVLTDASMFPNVLDNLREMIETNKLQDRAKVAELNWGSFDDHSTELLKLEFDYIIGSDLFYAPKDFESLIATVHFALLNSPNAIFITAYQERISTRCIDILLDRWDLEAKQLDFYGPNEIYEHLSQHIHIYSGKTDTILVTSTWDNADLSSVFILEFRLKSNS